MTTAFYALFTALNELVGDFVPLRRDRLLLRSGSAGRLVIELLADDADHLTIQFTPYRGGDRGVGPVLTVRASLSAGIAWRRCAGTGCADERSAFEAVRTINEFLRAGLALETANAGKRTLG